MKKLIGMALVLVGFAVGLLFKIGLSPSSRIAGVSQESGRSYQAWTVLYRNGTFEQLIRDTNTDRTFRHQGTWGQAGHDSKSQSFMAATGIKNGGNYLDLESPVEASEVVKTGSVPPQGISLMTPASSFQTPREADLREIEAFPTG